MKSRRYRVKVKDGMQGRVEDCLDRLDFEVAGTQPAEGDRTTIVAVGQTDMTPSELQRELRDLGCLGVSVEDTYQDARDVVGDEVDFPDDGVAYAAEPAGGDAEFDVDVARRELARAGELLDVGGASNSRITRQGDADRDRKWNDDLGRQSYREYIDHIVKRLVDEEKLGREQARDVVDRCIDDMVARGHLEAPPEGNDPDTEFSRWVGAAKGYDLAAECLRRVRGEG